MNRYEFENLISDYLDGTISFKDRTKIEEYIELNPEAFELIKNIKNSIKKMNNFDKVSVSEEFDRNLINKIKNVKYNTKRNSVFGFTPFYGAIFSALSIALFITITQLFHNPNNNNNFRSNNGFADESNNLSKNILQKEDSSVNRDLVKSDIDSSNTILKNKKKKIPKNIKFVNN